MLIATLGDVRRLGTGWRAWLTVLVAVGIVLAVGIAPSSAVDSDPTRATSLHPERGDIQVSELDEDSVEVRVDGEVLRADVRAEEGLVVVTAADESVVIVEIDQLGYGEVTTNSGAADNLQGGVVAAAGSVSCTMALWFVALISDAGWSVAVAAALAMGAAGAAVVAFAAAIGTSAFFAWVGRNC